MEFLNGRSLLLFVFACAIWRVAAGAPASAMATCSVRFPLVFRYESARLYFFSGFGAV